MEGQKTNKQKNTKQNECSSVCWSTSESVPAQISLSRVMFERAVLVTCMFVPEPVFVISSNCFGSLWALEMTRGHLQSIFDKQAATGHNRTRIKTFLKFKTSKVKKSFSIYCFYPGSNWPPSDQIVIYIFNAYMLYHITYNFNYCGHVDLHCRLKFSQILLIQLVLLLLLLVSTVS